MAAQPFSYSGQGYSPRGEKNRFVLPPQFRRVVKDSSGGARVLCLAKHDRWDCLTGFGLSRAGDLETQIDREEELAAARGTDFDRELRAIQLYGFAEVPFDDSGRFIMPEHLIGLARIDDGLYFQGAGGVFTIWNPAQLAAMGNGWEAAQGACLALVADAAAKERKK